jgi:Protein of unknown function (DUF4238)
VWGSDGCCRPLMEAMSKKHHYVPQSILKNFASGRKRNQICVFDKLRQAAYKSSIGDAGAENYFNTVTIAGERVFFEDAFQDCDEKLASLSKRLVRHRDLRVLTDQDRQDLANLASIQCLRGKLMRTTHLEFPRQLRKAIERRGNTLSPELLDELAGIDENTATLATLRHLREAHKFARHFLDKDWALCLAPVADPFWISDHPIVVSNVFPYGNLGFGSPGVEICWPIGAEVLISFRCRTIANKAASVSAAYAGILRADPVSSCESENVMFYNSLQVFQSARFLYGPTKDFSLARRAIREHPTTGEGRTSIMELGDLAGPELNEKMPEGKWLVVYGDDTHHMCKIEMWSKAPGGFTATIAAESAGGMQRLRADAPFSRVELYEDRVARQVMGGGVTIEGLQGHPETVLVTPSDPGMRALYGRRGQPRRAEDG